MKLLSNILWIILFLVSGKIYAQEPDSLNPRKVVKDFAADWKNIVMHDASVGESKFKILLITNRPFIPDHPDKIFFSNNVVSEFRKITYVIARNYGSFWTLDTVGSFEKAMSIVDDGSNILFFVHGQGQTFPMVLRMSSGIKSRYGLTVVAFDWPSANKNINKSLVYVRKCSANFYNTILNFEDYRKTHMQKEQSLNMLCHSLGNYFLARLVLDGNYQYLNKPIFDNLISNAAAIRAKRHYKIFEKLTFQKQIYVTSNQNDWVLHGANLLIGSKLLGNSPQIPLAKNAIYINFTSIAGKAHNYFFGTNEFENTNKNVKHFYDQLFNGKGVPLTEHHMFDLRNDGLGFDIK